MPKIIGVMSGSSCDGVDIWLADAEDCDKSILAKLVDYPKPLQEKLLAASQQELSVSQMFTLEYDYTNFLEKELLPITKAHDVDAIGVHGPTVFHQIKGDVVASKQLLQAERLCESLQTRVVSDFRSRDLAADGQGAPLAPLYHQARFAKHNKKLAIVNLGGIANISLLGPQGDVIGYDVGPGNAILDTICQKHFSLPYDKDGQLAAQGVIDQDVLTHMHADPFFHKSGPKSVHRDYFNQAWLDSLPVVSNPHNLLRTVTELTVELLGPHLVDAHEIFLVGGGANNRFLVECLQQRCVQPVWVPEDNDFIEAQLVAWLTVKRILGQKLDYTQVTGAKRPLLYGEVFQPTV